MVSFQDAFALPLNDSTLSLVNTVCLSFTLALMLISRGKECSFLVINVDRLPTSIGVGKILVLSLLMSK